MKIPHKVRITRKTAYEVLFVDRFDDIDQLGECHISDDKTVKQIKLKNGMSPLKQRQIYIHEILHAIEEETGEPIPHKVIYLLQESLERVLRLNGMWKAPANRKKKTTRK
jgi:hypothetical protein